MFNYFGSKGRIAHLYPAPRHRLIIEPFAGSARYALHHCRDHDVWLNDLDPAIAGIWRYIQTASRGRLEQVFRDELYPRGVDLRFISGLSREERDVVSLFFNRPYGGNIRTSWSAQRRRIDLFRHRVVELQPIIQTWKITCLPHDMLDNPEATWFVDAPYQYARTHYRYNCVSSYEALAEWCRIRRGQVIVCEGPGADWMPFREFCRQEVLGGLLQREFIWVKP